jgi:glycogen debranching enzyme
MPPRIRFDRAICTDPAEALQREWLETNGIGGFASSTVAGANTRRYHGLLVAATSPPSGRSVLLSKIEETLIVDGQRFELSTNLYPGVTHPAGYRFLTEFRLDPFPIFTFQAGGVTLTKRLFLIDGENTLVVEYEAVGSPCRLELRPLVAFRGYHELMNSKQPWSDALVESAGCITINPRPGLPPLHFSHAARRTATEGNWYFNFEYPIEHERGFDSHEDLYCPFMLEYDLTPGTPAALIVSTEEAPSRQQRRGPDSAPDQFIVRRGTGRTILAGYPWFGEWFRDTLISLPGLTLAARHFDISRDILTGCVQSLNQGMLPNRFPDAGGPPEYNTADATLWLFEAVRQFLAFTNDLAFVRKTLYDALKDIVDWHTRGTRFGIVMEPDGLLRAGDAGTQLTWMDARVNGQPVTPRHGKPVEIQALWYNALRVMATLSSEYTAMADLTGASFSAAFWNEAAGCLCDVIDGPRRDASVRPNQLLALSLGHCPVDAERARGVLHVVGSKLLTPYGLRTLSPDDPRYCGRYEGSPAERDAAYHQGTVWPWLLGPYITAQIRFNGERGRQEAAQILAALRDFMRHRGTGQLPEIFDGDPPHQPRGCFAQAWSVAEMERVAAEHHL